MPPKRKTTNDPLEILADRIDKLEKMVQDLTGSKILTVPTYDNNNLPATSVEGQVVIMQNAAAAGIIGGANDPNIQMATVVGGFDEGGSNQTINASAGDIITFINTIFQTDAGAVFGFQTVPTHHFTISEPGFYCALFQGEFNGTPAQADISLYITFNDNAGQTIWQTHSAPASGEASPLIYTIDNSSSGKAIIRSFDFAYVDTVPGQVDVGIYNSGASSFTLNSRTLHVMQFRKMAAGDFTGFPFSFP